MASRSGVVALIVGVGVGIVLDRWLLYPNPPSADPMVVEARQDTSPVNPPPAVAPSPTVPLPTPREAESNIATEAVAVDSHPASPEPSPPPQQKKPQLPPAVSPRTLEALRDKEHVDDFLDQVRQSNLFDTLRSAQTVTGVTGAVADIEGKFSGDISVPDRGQTWGARLEIRFRNSSREVLGRTVVALSRDGKVFSRHQGNGPISPTITSISNGGGVLIQASPTSYLQLYYLPQDHVLVGNYYEQEKPGDFRPRGTIRLQRE